MANDRYEKVLQRVLALDRRGIFLGLETTKKALKMFNNPHQKFKSILVAGTNGKGSTVAMLTNILCNAGYKVGMFISPHLLDVRERIQMNNRNIPETDFVRLAEKLFLIMKKEKGKIDLSFFEFLTVMAFVYFSEKKIDIAVVEVGLGGRLDATNVLEPLISVITTIGLDHQRFLGNTLSSIAFEKGGVIRRGGHLVTTVSQPKVLEQLKQLSEERGSQFWALGTHFFTRKEKEGFGFYNDFLKSHTSRWSELKLSLQGEFQMRNAAGVLGVVSLLLRSGWNISETAIRKGLMTTLWPGRLELLGPHFQVGGPNIVLDGAHNPQGIHVLMKALRNNYRYDKLHVVFGVMKDKNYRAMIKEMLVSSDALYFIEPSVKRALDMETLIQKMPEVRRKVKFHKEIRTALPKIIDRAGENDLICVTGSLYAVAEVKRFFQ